MASAQESVGPSRQQALPLRRRPERGMLGGVCAGLAERMQVEVPVVRVIMIMSATVGGLGVVGGQRGAPRRRRRRGGGRGGGCGGGVFFFWGGGGFFCPPPCI